GIVWRKGKHYTWLESVTILTDLVIQRFYCTGINICEYLACICHMHLHCQNFVAGVAFLHGVVYRAGLRQVRGKLGIGSRYRPCHWAREIIEVIRQRGQETLTSGRPKEKSGKRKHQQNR